MFGTVAKSVYAWLMVICIVFTGRAEQVTHLTITAGEWPPFLTSKSPSQGILAERIRHAFAEQGVDVTFEFYPWARALKRLEKGEADASAVWIKTPQRAEAFYFSDSLIKEQHVFFTLKTNTSVDSAGNSEALAASLTSRPTFVGIIGFDYGYMFDPLKLDNKMKVYRVPNFQQAFGMLLTGRVNYMPAERYGAYAYVRETYGEKAAAELTHLNEPCYEIDTHLLMSKKVKNGQSILKRFNDAYDTVMGKSNLAQLTRSGALNHNVH